MSTFRIDYQTECGKRGVWHHEAEGANPDEVASQCASEIKHVAAELRRTTGFILSKLIVVEVSERDVGQIENPATLNSDEK